MQGGLEERGSSDDRDTRWESRGVAERGSARREVEEKFPLLAALHHVQARRGNVLSNHGFRLQLLRLTRAAGGVLATEVRRQERECLGSCPG